MSEGWRYDSLPIWATPFRRVIPYSYPCLPMNSFVDLFTKRVDGLATLLKELRVRPVLLKPRV
jgi:hypothetical protein